MEEKKLTDEVVAENAITDDTEIDVGMIEKSVLFDKEQNKEQYVWLLKGSIWKTYKLSKVLDLIHRLQSEKDKPKRKKILANRVYSDATLKSWKKEDLIEQIRILEHNWSCAEEALNNSVKNSDKIFAEQKAEIERLTEENIEERDIHFKNLCEYKDEIARLQNQVDELSQANIDLWNANQCGVKLAKNPYKGVEVE